MTEITKIMEKKYSHYYVLYLLITLLAITNLNELNALFELWFLGGEGFSKRPVIWLIAFFLMHKNLSRERLLNRSTSKIDVIFLVVILSGVFITKDQYSNIMLTLLLVSIWFYSTDIKYIATIFIVWTFLIFSLPYYFLLTPFLQDMAVNVVEPLLRLFGIPILVKEYSIAIPRGLFQVEQSCSGAGYLANNLILLFFYSLLSKFNIKQYLLAAISTVIISLLMNWVRILSIVFVAHHWGFDVPFFVKGHQDFGWAVYVVFLVPFFYIFLKIDRMNQSPFKWVKNWDYPVFRFPSIYLLIPIFILSTI